MQNQIINSYFNELNSILNEEFAKNVNLLKKKVLETLRNEKNIFICGNGGSGSNANHIANDFIFAKTKKNFDHKIKVDSLNSNNSVITCIANDISYKDIFSYQLKSKASKDDLLIVLSGSGNSENIVEAVKYCNNNDIECFGILGFDGGKTSKIIHNYIHIDSFDMQICEDAQTIIFHIIIKDIIDNE